MVCVRPAGVVASCAIRWAGRFGVPGGIGTQRRRGLHVNVEVVVFFEVWAALVATLLGGWRFDGLCLLLVGGQRGFKAVELLFEDGGGAGVQFDVQAVKAVGRVECGVGGGDEVFGLAAPFGVAHGVGVGGGGVGPV